MKNYPILVCIILLLCCITFSGSYSQSRQIINLNDSWQFRGKSASGRIIDEKVTIPHSWNARDAQEGISYYRGAGHYSKSFESDPSWKGRRVFLRFEGVNIVSVTSLNGQVLGEHKGGYAAFCYELTDHLLWDQPNNLEVEVDNAANLEVLPLVGDFNNYGGIYRPVTLLVTDPVCITPLDFASPGIYMTQKEVTRERGVVEVLTKISNKSALSSLEVQVTVVDADDADVGTSIDQVELSGGQVEFKKEITIVNPHLWNGKQDPYLYTVRVQLRDRKTILDEVIQPLGLRYFRIDANEGFYLNDVHLPLHGVSRHQDRIDMGSAITDKEHHEDMAIMLEMGINALRLAHYQHAETIYDIADSSGLIVWAELPWVGMPAGFLAESNGYENTPEFHANARQQLTELIRQNYNHPSIVMWSIFNEIQNPEGSEPTEFIVELNNLAKAEDPSRLTVGASMLDPEGNENIHDVTDAIAWNRYFGWYYKMPENMADFLDEIHRTWPEYKIGISEYGAGGSIQQHTDKLVPPNPMGTPHPEEWQSYYHEQHLKIFNERPFVWGTFVWNMFDFGSHFRREGDHEGRNDKGLVTYDRKTRKDAFYLYKANWSNEPVLHIESSRYVFREAKTTSVKVYSNLPEVTLEVNGKSYGTKVPEMGIVVWENIDLDKGNNGIIVSASHYGVAIVDDCVWVLEPPFSGMRLMIKAFDFMAYATTVGLGFLAVGVFIWIVSGPTRKTAKATRIFWRVVSTLVILVAVLVLVAKVLFASLLG